MVTFVDQAKKVKQLKSCKLSSDNFRKSAMICQIIGTAVVTFVDQAKKVKQLKSCKLSSDNFRKSPMICRIIDTADDHFC